MKILLPTRALKKQDESGVRITPRSKSKWPDSLVKFLVCMRVNQGLVCCIDCSSVS